MAAHALAVWVSRHFFWNALTLSPSHPLNLSLALSLTRLFSHSLTLTLSRSLTLSLSHALAPHSLAPSLAPSFSHSPTLSLTHSHSLTLPVSSSQSLSLSRLSLTLSLVLSLARSHLVSLSLPHFFARALSNLWRYGKSKQLCSSTRLAKNRVLERLFQKMFISKRFSKTLAEVCTGMTVIAKYATPH